jgi:hypothetical protein
MKGILKRLTLVTLVFAMATALMASPSMAEDESILHLSQMEATLGKFQTWPLEEHAAWSEYLRQRAEQGDEYALFELSGTVHSLPGEDNMTFEEAIGLARKGIIAKYGVEEAALLGNLGAEASFYTLFLGYEVPRWEICYKVKGCDYYVSIVDQTGEMNIFKTGDSVG